MVAIKVSTIVKSEKIKEIQSELIREDRKTNNSVVGESLPGLG